MEQGEITWRNQAFDRIDLQDATLVFAATDIADVDIRVSELARAAGIPVNAVDRPDHSDFIMPAIVDRAPIVVAISSGGSAPVLARKIRSQIESLLPARIGELARFADQFPQCCEGHVQNRDGKTPFLGRLLQK